MDLSNAETRHINKDDFDYLEFTAFDKYSDHITAAFVIKGRNHFDLFGDGAEKRLQRFGTMLSLDANKIVTIKNQVHGDECNIVEVPKQQDGIDAMITNKKEISLVTRVADCIAVLVYDPVQNVIANIHSGWRGTIKRIAPKTVVRMKNEFGTNPSDVICVLCPSIGVDHFEVDKDVKDLFIAEYGERYMYDFGKKTHIDAARHLSESLIEIGVKPENIHDSGLCTVCNKDYIYSYRGSDDADKKLRNAAIICLK